MDGGGGRKWKSARDKKAPAKLPPTGTGMQDAEMRAASYCCARVNIPAFLLLLLLRVTMIGAGFWVHRDLLFSFPGSSSSAPPVFLPSLPRLVPCNFVSYLCPSGVVTERALGASVASSEEKGAASSALQSADIRACVNIYNEGGFSSSGCSYSRAPMGSSLWSLYMHCH